MKTLPFNKHVFAASVLICLVNLAAAENHLTSAPYSELKATLLELEIQRANAIKQSDTLALRKLMDRYYRHVESRGRVRSKTELLTALERGDFRFQLYENESTDIQVLDSGKTAVIAGVFRSQQVGSKLFRGRYVRVWVHEQDGWRNTFHQATEIGPDKSDCKCN